MLNDPTKKEIERLGEYTPLGTKEMMYQMGMEPPASKEFDEGEEQSTPPVSEKREEISEEMIKKFIDSSSLISEYVVNSDKAARKIWSIISPVLEERDRLRLHVEDWNMTHVKRENDELKQEITALKKQVAGFLTMIENRDKDVLIHIPPPKPTT